MALILATHSIVIQDSDGERMSFPLYGLYDDATADLTALSAAWAAEVALVNDVTDGAIVSHAVTLQLALPGGIRQTPVAGSEIERTGLFSFNMLDGPYGVSVDIPAFKNAAYIGNRIDVNNTPVAAFVSALQYQSGTILNVDPSSRIGFGALRTAQKTFRKHRAQTKRT